MAPGTTGESWTSTSRKAPTEQDEGGDELKEGDRGRVDARHAGPEDGEESGKRPEQQPEGPEGSREQAAEPREPGDRSGGGRGVPVRAAS